MSIESILMLDNTVCSKEKDILQTAFQYKKIILFGGGITGEQALTWCNQNSIGVTAICDNNIDKVGTFLGGIKIVSPEELRNDISEKFILISCDAHASIREQLSQMGYDVQKQVGFFDKLWVSKFDFKLFVKEHIEEYSYVYKLLADQKSRDVFVGMINYKLSMNLDYIIPYTDKHEDMYFDKELIMSKNLECFVDIGAYIGDTLEDYIKKHGSICEKYVCFEPDLKNVKQLRNFIIENDLKNVEVFEKGISNEKKLLKFKIDLGASTNISDDGEEVIECTTIDDELFTCNEMNKSMLKLDIEGAEYQALEGAKETIKKYHPILAVCVYHKPEDMFILPIYLEKMYSGYKFFLRQYEESANETVCYAIPLDWEN